MNLKLPGPGSKPPFYRGRSSHRKKGGWASLTIRKTRESFRPLGSLYLYTMKIATSRILSFKSHVTITDCQSVLSRLERPMVSEKLRSKLPHGSWPVNQPKDPPRCDKRGIYNRPLPPTWMSQKSAEMVWKWVRTYNLLLNAVYWGYNPFTNHLLTFWDIQAWSSSMDDRLQSMFVSFFFSAAKGFREGWHESLFGAWRGALIGMLAEKRHRWYKHIINYFYTSNYCICDIDRIYLYDMNIREMTLRIERCWYLPNQKAWRKTVLQQQSKSYTHPGT